MIALDLLYLLVLGVLAPGLIWRSIRTGRYRKDLAAKLLGRVTVPSHQEPVVWFHAVSVGEVNLLGTLVPAFLKRHPHFKIVVSATTDTGLVAARLRFAGHTVIAWPFDFSWAVARALDTLKPTLIVLAESELWPNFLNAASVRAIPVAVVNARLSPRSFSRLRRIARLARRGLLDRVSRFAVQEEEYAQRYRQLGVAADRLVVTGSVKYDGALRERVSDLTVTLQQLLGFTRSNAPRVWLAGSTHAPEEAIVLSIYQRLRSRFPTLRLILVPRHPDRFEEVAQLLSRTGLQFVRRSRIVQPLSECPEVILLDSIGELGAAWGLADVGFTGGSLDGKRGGQSMIEPAGYGVPCVFGPHIWNFRDVARRLVEAGGARMVTDEQALEEALVELIGDTPIRLRMGQSARELIRRQQGATERTLDVLDTLLSSASLSRAA